MFCDKLIHNATKTSLQKLRPDSEQLLLDLQSRRRSSTRHIRAAANQHHEPAVVNRRPRLKSSHLYMPSNGRKTRLHRDDHERRDAQRDPKRRLP